MKIIKSTTVELSDYEFDELTASIVDAVYALSPEIRNIYEIHIDYISDDWHVEFVPMNNKVPVLKVEAITSYVDNKETLYIKPQILNKIPPAYAVSTYDDALYISNILESISEFVLQLYDFSFEF